MGGDGVLPDIAVPAERALIEAHAAAVRKPAATSSDSARLGRLLVTLDARRQPSPVDTRAATRFAGTYEGRQVAVIDGKLTYARREGGLGEELTPLGGDRFGLGATRFTFERAAKGMTLVIEQPNGTRLSLMREPKSGSP